MAASVKITGVQATVDGIGKIREGGLFGMWKGITKAAEEILRMSKYYCPKDTFALVNSGHIIVSRAGELTSFARVEYGGETAPYAIYVHENMDVWHAPPTQAKFLDRAIWESYNGKLGGIITAEIAAEIARTVRGTGGGFEGLVNTGARF